MPSSDRLSAETIRVVTPATPALPGWWSLLRPRQWLKNVFVLAPVLFAGRVMDRGSLTYALSALAIFCVAASAVYVLNDMLDREDDARHPRKRHTRPLASGAVSDRAARWTFALLFLLAVAGAAALRALAAPLAVYFAVNLAYSLRLKHVAVVDLFCIASGFVVRAWAGAAAVGVPLSGWMLITTLCLALYLAAIKRRQEMRGTAEGGGRRVLGRYSESLLDRYAQTAASGAIVFYAVYVVDVRPALMTTVPLVILGFFRYGYLAEMHGEGECPTDTFWRDAPLALTGVAWCAVSAWAMWPG